MAIKENTFGQRGSFLRENETDRSIRPHPFLFVRHVWNLIWNLVLLREYTPKWPKVVETSDLLYNFIKMFFLEI